MSRHMMVRVPPVAPRSLEVMETETVEWLVREALFGGKNEGFYTPEESLTSHDEGMTGGAILKATGTGRTFLDGALAALPSNSEAHKDLAAFLAALDEHGALLITLEH